MHHQKYPDRITVNGFAADHNPALVHYEAYNLKELSAIRTTIEQIANDAGGLVPKIARARRVTSLQTPLRKSHEGTTWADNRRPPRREKRQGPPSS